MTLLCRLLQVSRSGYYAWCRREVSARSHSDQRLLAQIQSVHDAHRGHCGALKTWRVLIAQGVDCGKHQVARIRRQHGIVAHRRRRFIATTRSKYTLWRAPNRLQRDFRAAQPNRVWVGDVTYIPTREGFLYLAVLIDLYARRVVGYAMSNRNDEALVLGALQMALLIRRPVPGLIHHTDQGAPYAGKRYRSRLAAAGLVSSMSRKGDCWDNAVAESFFATLEFELLEAGTFPTRVDARSAIFEFIEVFYNRQRAHQSLDYQTPVQVEQAYRLTLN